MASYNHFVTDPYAVLTIQLTMLFIYSGLVLNHDNCLKVRTLSVTICDP